MSVDNIDPFFEGQDQLSADELNLIREFLNMLKRGISGVSPINVVSSENGGVSISIEGQDERTDFVLDKLDSLSETGVIIPEFGGSTGLDSDGNVFARTPLVDYAGSRWTFLNQGGTADGLGDVATITSAIDTSKPFIATVSATVVSGDYVGVKTGESILQKDFPGFRVLADTSGLTGGTTALLVRRPVDGMLAKAQATIAKDASGNVKLSETDGTTHGGNFSAFNIGSSVSSGALIQLGEDATGSVFFKPPGADVACDCAEIDGTTDTYDQLSDYCDIVNLEKVLPFSGNLTFRVVTEEETIQFVLEIDDEASFSTPIETTAPFTWKTTSQSVNMVTLAGSISALKSGTHNAITIELKETADPGNQWSGLGGVQKISEYGEADPTGLQIHIIDDTGGFRHLEAYASNGTTLLFHTATYNSTGDQAVIDDGGKGVTGTITIDAVGSPTTGGRWDWEKLGDTNSEFVGILIDDLFTKTREKVWLRKISNTDFKVEIYSGGCKIGETAFSETTGAKTVSALTPNGWTCPSLSGTITVDRWFHSDFSIIIECPNGECCGTNNCSGGEPTGRGCIFVDWENNITSDTGCFCVDGFVNLDDPRVCSGPPAFDSEWDPASFRIIDPDTSKAYELTSESEAFGTCCSDLITWTFLDDNGSDDVIETLNPLGFISGTFTIGDITYTVFIQEDTDCDCQSTYPLS